MAKSSSKPEVRQRPSKYDDVSSWIQSRSISEDELAALSPSEIITAAGLVGVTSQVAEKYQQRAIAQLRRQRHETIKQELESFLRSSKYPEAVVNIVQRWGRTEFSGYLEGEPELSKA